MEKTLLELINEKKSECHFHIGEYADIPLGDTMSRVHKRKAVKAFYEYEALCELAKKLGIKTENVLSGLSRFEQSELLHIVFD